jgi:hypothetical protein
LFRVIIFPLKELYGYFHRCHCFSEAAKYAVGEVEEEFGDAADVAHNRFIGNSNLYLKPY